MRDNGLHIQKTVVYEQFFEFKSNFNGHMIWDLKSTSHNYKFKLHSVKYHLVKHNSSKQKF